MKQISIISIALIAVFAFIEVSNAALLNGGDMLRGASDSFTYKHFGGTASSSVARTTVFGGAGELGRVTINTTGEMPIRLYDYSGASTTIATSTLTPIAVIKASTAEQTLSYDIAFTQGLVMEMPAGYAGDLTFSVR